MVAEMTDESTFEVQQQHPDSAICKFCKRKTRASLLRR